MGREKGSRDSEDGDDGDEDAEQKEEDQKTAAEMNQAAEMGIIDAKYAERDGEGQDDKSML